MNAADLQTAVSLLTAMGPEAAARTLGDPRDLRAFLDNNRLELEEYEIQRLKEQFRA